MLQGKPVRFLRGRLAGSDAHDCTRWRAPVGTRIPVDIVEVEVSVRGFCENIAHKIWAIGEMASYIRDMDGSEVRFLYRPLMAGWSDW